MRQENVGLRKKHGRLLKAHAECPLHPAAGIFSLILLEKLQFSLYSFLLFTEDEQQWLVDKMDNLKVAAAIEVSEVQKMTKEVESSVTRGLPIECISGLVTEESCHVTKEVI